MNPTAWDVMRKFASSDSITLPEVEARLKTLLGSSYVEQDWRPAIDAIFSAENDTELAIREVERLAAAAANASRLKIRIHHQTSEQLPPEVVEVERDLVAALKELHILKGIPAECVPSVDEVVEPKEEHEFRMEENKFEGGDAEIVAHVKHLIAVKNGEIIDVDDSEEEEGESDLSAGLTFSDVAQMCEKVEAAYWRFGCGEQGLTFPRELRCFRGLLGKMETKSKKQVTLHSFWAK